MMKKIRNSKIVDHLGKLKTFMNRSVSYIGVVQLMLVLYIALRTQEVIRIPVFVYPLIIVLTLGFLLLVGYLDISFGIFKAEQKAISWNNPALRNIESKIDILTERIDNVDGDKE